MKDWLKFPLHAFCLGLILLPFLWDINGWHPIPIGALPLPSYQTNMIFNTSLYSEYCLYISVPMKVGEKFSNDYDNSICKCEIDFIIIDEFGKNVHSIKINEVNRWQVVDKMLIGTIYPWFILKPGNYRAVINVSSQPTSFLERGGYLHIEHIGKPIGSSRVKFFIFPIAGVLMLYGILSIVCYELIGVFRLLNLWKK